MSSMFRTSDRSAPHNLYADTELVRKVIDEKGMTFNPPPSSIYPFGNNQDNWVAGSARVIIKYSDFTTVIWKLDGNGQVVQVTDEEFETIRASLAP